MIAADRRDDRRRRMAHHIGRVRAAACAHFDDGYVRRIVREQAERRRRQRLEIGEPLRPPPDVGQHIRQRLVLDQPPRDTDALVHTDQVRRGEDVHGQSRRLGHRPDERAGRSLAVRARDVDRPRNPILRITQLNQRLANMRRAECRRDTPAGRIPEPVKFSCNNSGVAQDESVSSHSLSTF